MNDFEKYQKAFSEKAIGNGFSTDEINRCLKYSKPIINNGFPIIYNTSHLGACIGYNKSYLKRASAYTKSFYKTHVILKKNGKQRYLSEPLPSLKEIQYWILENILTKVKISKYSKAYSANRSIKDHVRYHKGQKIVLTLDIEGFFDNITLPKVQDIFLKIGYSKLISNLLAKLCCLEECLPQGAPTSPRISNIVLNNFDEVISEYCRKNDIKYTRYADDLAFSGDFSSDDLIHLVSTELNHIGLFLNESKTMVMSGNQRQIISGIVVNSKAQVPREKRDELRQALYYIRKHGLEDHLERINCTKANYVRHLLGIANYILFINPKDIKTLAIKEELKKYLNEPLLGS